MQFAKGTSVTSLSEIDLGTLAERYSKLKTEKQAIAFVQKQNMADWPLEKTERFLSMVEHPGLFSSDVVENVIRHRITNRLIKIYVEDELYQPVAVFIEHSLKNDFECEGLYADDTAHVTELANEKIIYVDEDDEINVELLEEYSEIPIRMFIINDQELRSGGYKNVEKIELVDGRLKIANPQKGGTQLLFTIIKGSEELYY